MPSRRLRTLLLGLSFLVSGFWHGASWNYVLWGAYHGLLLIGARAIPQIPKSLRPLQVVAMFALTCIGWLIFRETELHQLIADFRLSPSASTGFSSPSTPRVSPLANNVMKLLARLANTEMLPEFGPDRIRSAASIERVVSLSNAGLPISNAPVAACGPFAKSS